MSAIDRIEIQYSPLAVAAGALISLALAALCAALAFHLIEGVEPGSPREFAGWTGLVLFGASSVALAWRVVSRPGPVVVLADSGITDTRIASDEIPWNAIRDMRVWSFRGQKVLVLDVDPVVEARLRLTRMARWSREPNRRLGADGLCVATAGLRIDRTVLTRLVAERIASARGA